MKEDTEFIQKLVLLANGVVDEGTEIEHPDRVSVWQFKKNR